MLVACLGDVMLDVIVTPTRPLVEDDDVPARITFAAGGQAANVATWVVDLGDRARVFGPRSDLGAGRLVERALEARGVELCGETQGRGGTVLSLLGEASRSMASDPGDHRWLEDVRSGPWLSGADWLFVSGYALLRSPDPQRIVQTAGVARAHGTRVAIDLSSSSLIDDFGAEAFASLCAQLRAAVVFATDEEWALCRPFLAATGPDTLVLKHGARGCTFVTEATDLRRPLPGPVVDVTGAGDALAAGFLVGGPGLAMSAAARCVAGVGAQPAGPDEPEG